MLLIQTFVHLSQLKDSQLARLLTPAKKPQDKFLTPAAIRSASGTYCFSKTGLNGRKFSDIALEEKGVALVPGTSFGDSAEKFVRISYANSMENLEKAIYRLSTI